MSGIPSSGDAIVERYLIDEANSNFMAGSRDQNMDKVEGKTVTIEDGRVDISLEVRASTVQLFKILHG